jgi:hypothetical protein
MSDENWLADGTSPDRENFLAIVLEPTGFRVFFSPYQVAAYAAGPFEVVIPYAALVDDLNLAGPLKELTRQPIPDTDLPKP